MDGLPSTLNYVRREEETEIGDDSIDSTKERNISTPSHSMTKHDLQSLDCQTILVTPLCRVVLPERQHLTQLVQDCHNVRHDTNEQQSRNKGKQLFPRSIIQVRKERLKDKDPG